MRRLLLAGALAGALAVLTATACGDDGESAGTVALPPGMQPPSGDPVAPSVPFSPATPQYAVRVAARHPHDRQAFTQGLQLHDGVLFESTGEVGRSSVRHVELATGQVRRQADLPSPHFGEGITIHDGRVYQLTWKSQRGYVYDAATLAVADSFTYAGEGWGLASDGEALWMSDGTSRLRVVSPAGFQVQRTVQVTDGGRPVPYLNELEWVDGELWANVWLTEWIARIDPATGTVTGWIDARGLLTADERRSVDVLNGIAHDPATGRVLLTGKWWPAVFEVEVVRKP